MKNLRTTLKRWLSGDSTNPKNYLQNAVDTGKKFSPDNTTSIEVNTNISVYRKKWICWGSVFSLVQILFSFIARKKIPRPSKRPFSNYLGWNNVLRLAVGLRREKIPMAPKVKSKRIKTWTKDKIDHNFYHEFCVFLDSFYKILLCFAFTYVFSAQGTNFLFIRVCSAHFAIPFCANCRP